MLLLVHILEMNDLLVALLSWYSQRIFGVPTLEKAAHDDYRKLASAVYLQVSIISQALIFVTRSRSWSFVERPGLLLVAAFIIAQLVSHCNFVLVQLPFL